MLKKKNKTPQATLKKVLKRRPVSVTHTKNLTLSLYEGEGKEPKVTFVVSKKVAKTAPLRNKLKRRGYAIIKNLLPKIKDHKVLVFYFKKGGQESSYKELEENISTLVKNILT